MTTEELVRIRYRVLIDYPDSPFTIGDVLECCEGTYHLSSYSQFNRISSPQKFPSVFRAIEWFEYRSIETLKSVTFVKVVTYRGYWLVGDIVPAFLKLDDQLNPIGYTLDYNHFQFLTELLPATKEEYDNHKKRNA